MYLCLDRVRVVRLVQETDNCKNVTVIEHGSSEIRNCFDGGEC